MQCHGTPWLTEDAINLLEMMAEGRDWQYVATTLGRSINACKLRYGMLRFTSKMSKDIRRVNKLVIVGRIKV